MPRFTEVERRILQKYNLDPGLSNSLASIRGVMEDIWANDAPKIVQNFTDHGEKHSERVAYFAEKLLQVNPSVEFSQEEIYLFLGGIYLHDIGMQCDIVKYPEIKRKAENLGAKFNESFTAKTTNRYSLEEQKEIRKNHHLISAAWIDYLYAGKDQVLSHRIKTVPYDLVDDLIDVCKFHSKLSINDCPDYSVNYPDTRKRMVASLLRLADELDITGTRVNIETVKIFSIEPDNSIYWWLHNYTKINFVGCNKIHLKVDLHPEDFDAYSSFIQEDYITTFKNKNQPILNVLVGQNIPIVFDNNPGVVKHSRVEKFPPDIVAIFDKKIQNVHKKVEFTENKPEILITEFGNTIIGDTDKFIDIQKPNEESFESEKEENPEAIMARKVKLIMPNRLTLLEGNKTPSYIKIETKDYLNCTLFSDIFHNSSTKTYTFNSPQASYIGLNELSKILETFFTIFEPSWSQFDNPTFIINQTCHKTGMNYSWFGFGPDNFIQAIREQSIRYSEAKIIKPHHREVAGFIARGSSFLFYIALQPDVVEENANPTFDYMQVGFILDDFPFNTEKFIDFYKKAGLEEPTSIKEGPNTKEIDLRIDNLKLNQEGLVTYGRPGDIWASKVIIENPFYGNKKAHKDTLTHKKLVVDLIDSDPLREHHEYFLKKLIVMPIPYYNFGFCGINVVGNW